MVNDIKKEIRKLKIIEEKNRKEEVEAAKEIFNKNILLFLSADGDEIFEIIEDYNLILIFLLCDDQRLQKELENKLYVNEEIFSEKDFISEGRTQSPTITNWLKDFINKNGSGIFDNLVLSKYITDSENAKKLDSNERNLLKKLLILYRNLKFFPESLANVPAEDWQIIPVEKESDEVKKTPVPQIPPTPNVRGEGDKLAELRAMAEQFSVGSLERRAIEEEIKKLEIEN